MRRLMSLVVAVVATGVTVVSAEDVLVRVDRVFDGHQWIPGGTVLIRDGKVAAIGPNLSAAGATELKFERGVLTPGLIDAMSSIDTEQRSSFYDVEGGWSEAPGAHGDYTSVPGAACPHDSAHESEHGGHAHAASGGLIASLSDQAILLTPAHPDQEHLLDTLCVCGGHHLVDEARAPLSSALARRAVWGEQSSEVTPHLRVLDGVNPYSTDFDRLVRGGVTTIFVSPDSTAVIGARGAIMKTAGPLDRRILREADAAKASLGYDPSRRVVSNTLPVNSASFMMRRPTTRMGVDFVFRKAFFDAERDGRGLPLYGSDQPPRDALPVLRRIRAGEVPLRVQARLQHDILTAIRYSHELGLPGIIIEEATEAHKCVAALAEARHPVIYGPLYYEPQRWRRPEVDEPQLDAPRLLAEAGVPLALTAQECRDEEGLVRQAMFAARYGLPAEQALRAITSAPAELMNIADQVGSLRPGAAADLVVWSGDPLAAASRPLLVMIDGEVVHRAN